MFICLRLPCLVLLVLWLYNFYWSTLWLAFLAQLASIRCLDVSHSSIALIRCLGFTCMSSLVLASPFLLSFYLSFSLGSTVFYQPLLVLSASGLGVAGVEVALPSAFGGLAWWSIKGWLCCKGPTS